MKNIEIARRKSYKGLLFLGQMQQTPKSIDLGPRELKMIFVNLRNPKKFLNMTILCLAPAKVKVVPKTCRASFYLLSKKKRDNAKEASVP